MGINMGGLLESSPSLVALSNGYLFYFLLEALLSHSVAPNSLVNLKRKGRLA